MKKKNDHGVFAAVRMAAASHRLLTVGTVLCVAASVAASLLPPLLLLWPPPCSFIYGGRGAPLDTQLIIDLLAVCGAPLHHITPR